MHVFLVIAERWPEVLGSGIAFFAHSLVHHSFSKLEKRIQKLLKELNKIFGRE